MTNMITSLKTGGRAALVALTLSATALTAMPAMAQEPSFNFSLGIGGNGQPNFSFGVESGKKRPDFARYCLSDRQIRNGLEDYGFRSVRIGRELRGDRVEVFGRYGRSWYSMRVDRCTGEVDRVERLRRGFPGGGFGLQFNF